MSGRVAALAPDAAVVEVGGVGLLVQCTPATLATLQVGEPAALTTALVVREAELTLYGFATADEREVFEVLQTAGGVGPRLAQAVLAVHTPDAVRRAVATEDLDALTRVPGIGRKGAQRIVLDLKDRLGPPATGTDGDGAAGKGRPAPAAGRAPAGPRPWQEQVRAALLGLGYSAREADDTLGALAPPAADTHDLTTLLRQALAVLRPG